MFDNLILVRYSPGAGGETLSWWLQSLVGLPSIRAEFTQEHRTKVYDVFDRVLQIPRILVEGMSLHLCPQWRDLAPAEMAKYLYDNYYSKAPPAPYHIGKMHYFLPPDGYRVVFGRNTKFIDLKQEAGFEWVPWTFLAHKALFNSNMTPNLTNPLYAHHPRYQEVCAFFDKHGWVYQWHLAMLHNHSHTPDINDVRTQVEASFLWEMNSLLDNGSPRFPSDTDYEVDLTKFLFDPSLGEFHKITDALGFPYNTEHDERLRSWVAGNVAILDDLGLKPYLANPLSMQDQTALLVDTFTARHKRLTN